jgi:ubiquinone/menaquinone biosynthesis C-methylase UbiE
MSGHNYIIEGGEEGKKRLDVLGAVLNPYSRELLEKIGPLNGKQVLDLGCGSGTVSLMLAPLLQPGGSVTGIDFDPHIIQLAAKEAAHLHITNAIFETGDVYDIQYENKFDIAYSRFLLSHLVTPELVINKMIKSLKSGGQLVIEDIDFSGHYCYPPSAAFNSYVEYFTIAAQNNGHHPNIGLALLDYMQKTDLQDIQLDVINPVFTEGAGKWMAYITFEKIRQTLLKQDLIKEQDFESLLRELKVFTEDKNSLISMPRIFRVWGRKK